MGTFATFGVFLLASASILACSNALDNNFNVMTYGAKSDGRTDDSPAFLKAWDAACRSPLQSPTVYVPHNGTFLVNPITFAGPCNSSAINFSISGTILAPASPSSWAGIDATQWLGFMNVNGLHIDGDGSGLINGQGKAWWDQSCRDHPEIKNCSSRAPTAWKFVGCNESSVRHMKLINSGQVHIIVAESNNFIIENVTIDTPANSPNTDGIHIQSSQNVTVTHSNIGCGDDCISIGDSSFIIEIDNIGCGPGHGISIGSLGRGGEYAQVQNINVTHANFSGTTNGARIKTWEVGKGYVRNVTFENLSFSNVENPIIIDQHYCDRDCKEQVTGVAISNVVYRGAIGTSASDIAINLNCSKSVPCSRISMESINITPVKAGGKVTSNCSNAFGKQVNVVPGDPCLPQN